MVVSKEGGTWVRHDARALGPTQTPLHVHTRRQVSTNVIISISFDQPHPHHITGSYETARSMDADSDELNMTIRAKHLEGSTPGTRPYQEDSRAHPHVDGGPSDVD
jgi:hypothetical protein